MKLSKKRLIILWVTVLIIVTFVGLDRIDEKHERRTAAIQSSQLVLYGYELGFFSLTAHNITQPKIDITQKKRGLYHLIPLGDYKYQLIVATLLIGLALFMTVREK